MMAKAAPEKGRRGSGNDDAVAALGSPWRRCSDDVAGGRGAAPNAILSHPDRSGRSPRHPENVPPPKVEMQENNARARGKQEHAQQTRFQYNDFGAWIEEYLDMGKSLYIDKLVSLRAAEQLVSEDTVR